MAQCEYCDEAGVKLTCHECGSLVCEAHHDHETHAELESAADGEVGTGIEFGWWPETTTGKAVFVIWTLSVLAGNRSVTDSLAGLFGFALGAGLLLWASGHAIAAIERRRFREEGTAR